MALLLGKALLWLCLSPHSEWAPALIVARVKNAYCTLLGVGQATPLSALENPVEKKLLVISGDDDTL